MASEAGEDAAAAEVAEACSVAETVPSSDVSFAAWAEVSSAAPPTGEQMALHTEMAIGRKQTNAAEAAEVLEHDAWT